MHWRPSQILSQCDHVPNMSVMQYMNDLYQGYFHFYFYYIHTYCKIYVFLSIYAGNSQLLIKTFNLPSPTELLLDLSIWVKQWVSYKLHELLTIREHSGSALLFGGSVLLIFLIFCDVMCVLFCLSSVSVLSIRDWFFGFL
jgi:hypothetical protein